jgi:hypothetical protein
VCAGSAGEREELGGVGCVVLGDSGPDTAASTSDNHSRYRFHIFIRFRKTVSSAKLDHCLPVAAVYAEGLAGDEAGFGAGEEGDGVGDVGGFGDAAQRGETGEVFDHLLAFSGAEELGVGGAGADGVDRDAAGAEFFGGDGGHLLDGHLAGGVNAVAGDGRALEGGGDVHDATAGAEAAGGLAQCEEGAAEVGVEDGAELLVSELGDWLADGAAGVVDDDVEAAEGLFGLGEKPGDVGGFADIGLDGEGLAAGGGDAGDDLRGGGGVARVVDDDGRAFGGEAGGDGGADAAGGTGDEGDFGEEGGHEIGHCGRIRPQSKVAFAYSRKSSMAAF